MRRLVLAALMSAAVTVWQVPGAAASGTSGPPSVVGPSEAADALLTDFNNDGFSDLAVGAPGEDVGSMTDAGAVTVLYGSTGGLTGAGSDVFTQNTAGVPSSAEAGDVFGAAVAVADFDNDGFADLAVGVPGEVGTTARGGAVTVLYGSASGLTGAGSAVFTQNSAGVTGSAENGDELGQALTASDFDGDGFADLAVGVPGENVGAVVDAGAVTVLYGSASGLSGAGSDQFTQNTAGVPSSAEESDAFGFALAGANFDGDGYADLAVGAPFEVGAAAAGAVVILPGSAGGLTGTGSQLFTQNSAGGGSRAEDGDFFGAALATGDLDSDSFGDLAIGVPAEDVGATQIENAGAVNVLYGSGDGLSPTGGALFTQNTAGSGDGSEPGDAFGFALVIGDFNADDPESEPGPPFDDLIIGVPGEDVESIDDAGAIHALYGTDAGVTSERSKYLHQDSAGVGSIAELGDFFGAALAAGDFNDGIGLDDLAVGVPFEDTGSGDATRIDAGAIIWMLGAADAHEDRGGPTGGILITQNTSGVPGSSEDGDYFGAALAAAAP